MMVGYCARVVRGLFVIGAVWLVLPPTTTQASGSWTSGEFAWGDTTTLHNMPTASQKHCRVETRTIIGQLYIPPESARMCVYERPGFRYAFYTKGSPTWWGSIYYENFFLVGLGSDRNMYVVENIDLDKPPIYVAGSNDMHYKSTADTGYGKTLTYIEDFPSKLWRITEFGKTFRYVLSQGVEKPFIPSSLDGPVIVGGVSASDNGRWIAAEISNVGFVRIDTTTRSVRGFSNYVHQYSWFSNPYIEFTISDDGTKIVAFDPAITPRLYSLDNSCELTTDTYDIAFMENVRTNECPTDDGRLYTSLFQKYEPNQVSSARPSGFNSDADTLYFDDVVDEEAGFATVSRKSLHAGEFIQESSLEYLALGDSFTSGEGDIGIKPDGSSYYLPGTEANNECHVSSRSYPFLLREQKNIASNRMKTIACSGAQVLPDYIGNPQSYKGQGNRVGNISGAVLASKRSDALKNFTPGIVTQLEFVKKYQPKTITLMGGGNDVGFASILEYCASPSWEGVFVDDTCGYAIEGHTLRKILGQSIQSQYQYTLALLRAVRQASPHTSVYVIGYPSFISEDEAAVCLNAAALNSAERTMIDEGVTAMNAMLKSAATSMGVKYIDIQDVLEGGRLCEGSEYVTGLNDIKYNMEKHGAEIFHPNARAHIKIFQRILADNFQVSPKQNTTPRADPIELDAHSQFGATDYKVAVQVLLAPTQLVEQSSPAISLPANSLAPDSIARLAVYSESTSLGDVQIKGDGSVNYTVALPATVKPGRHVLVVEGESPSGEPLQYYQFVTVVSKDVNDIDGDGVANSSDQCAFITSWIDEVTNRDVCKTTPIIEQDAQPQANTESSPVSSVQTGKRPISDLAASADSSESASVLNDSGKDMEKGRKTGGSSSKVLGARTSKVNRGSTISLVAVGLLGVSTLIGGYGILRAIRNRL